MKRENQALSGSHEPDVVVTLRNDINELQGQIDELNDGLSYLARANMEMAKDMQTIYQSLTEVLDSLKGVDPNEAFFNFNNFSKDDLPN